MQKYIQILAEVIKMRITRDMALVALGAGMVLAYQRYREPMMEEMDKMVSKTMKCANHKLEEMM